MNGSLRRSVIAASCLFVLASTSFAANSPKPNGSMRTRLIRAATTDSIASLTTVITAPDALDAQNHGTFHFTVTNTSSVDAHNVTLITWVGEQATSAIATSPEWNCGGDGFGRTHCTTASIAAGTSKELVIEVVYPAPYLRVDPTAARTTFDIPAGTIAPDELTLLPLAFYRDYVVRNTADSGTDSLRDAITRANAECDRDAVPCRIAFHLPPSESAVGVYTIRPLTPLPSISVDDVSVDGETQTRFGGDTNADGPEVAIEGSQVDVNDGFDRAIDIESGRGSGLTFHSSFTLVQGMAIGGFPGNGLLIFSRDLANQLTIRRNFLGIDANGTTADANALRGIMVYGCRGDIDDNVISGNIRSGIWLSGAAQLTVQNNRIGLAARTNDAVPNGASGIFFGGREAGYTAENHVIGNVIAFSGDFGIGIATTSGTIIDANTITANAQGAIDVGLDGPTIANAPLVTSARFDPITGMTTMEGTRIVETPADRSRVLVYSNSGIEAGGTSEGEIYLGDATTDASGHFTLTVAADLRGRWIDAMQIAVIDYGDEQISNSTEFGPASRVTQ